MFEGTFNLFLPDISTVEIRQQPLLGKPQAAAVSTGHLAAELCFGTQPPSPHPAQPRMLGRPSTTNAYTPCSNLTACNTVTLETGEEG